MFSNNILISIILPVYNGEKYLSEAITSVVNQSFTAFELIIVNDCSTDNSLEIANAYAKKDNRITIVTNKTNLKLPVSLNVGHRIAKGKYITWTSDDNILKSNFLSVLVKEIEKNKADIAYSNYDIIYEEGILKRKHCSGPTEHLLFGNKIGASFIYKKEVFEQLEGYDETLFLLEDYDFWIRASLRFKFLHVYENLYQYRIHEKSLTANIQESKKINNLHKRKVEKVFEKISTTLSWNHETKNYLVTNFIGELIDFESYFKYKQILIKDLNNYNNIHINIEEVFNGLILNLRMHLMSNKKNYNIKLLFKILKYEPNLLVYKSFSKKVTLNYIIKSLRF